MVVIFAPLDPPYNDALSRESVAVADATSLASTSHTVATTRLGWDEMSAVTLKLVSEEPYTRFSASEAFAERALK